MQHPDPIPLDAAPDVEKISDADFLLVERADARAAELMKAASEIQSFARECVIRNYARPGERIDIGPDGVITRSTGG